MSLTSTADCLQTHRQEPAGSGPLLDKLESATPPNLEELHRIHALLSAHYVEGTTEEEEREAVALIAGQEDAKTFWQALNVCDLRPPDDREESAMASVYNRLPQLAAHRPVGDPADMPKWAGCLLPKVRPNAFHGRNSSGSTMVALHSQEPARTAPAPRWSDLTALDNLSCPPVSVPGS